MLRLGSSFFLKWMFNSSSTIYWRYHLVYCVFLAPLPNISWLYIHGFIMGSLLSNMSLFCNTDPCVPAFVPFHTVLITSALWYSVKWGSMTPSSLLFLRTALAILGHWWFRTNFRTDFPLLWETPWNSDRDCIPPEDRFGWYRCFSNISSSSPWTQGIFSFACIFSCFHQCAVVTSIEIFHPLG